MRRKHTYRNLKILSYSLLIIFIIGTYLFFRKIQTEYNSITTFEECSHAGYAVIPTYPEQCKIPGKVFTNTNQVASLPIPEATSTFPEKNMNPKNTSYDIEGVNVILQNGKGVLATTTDTSSSPKIVTYFGNDLRTDIDGDGKEDAVFLVTVTSSGTGTFYYLVSALNRNGGYVGTNGVLLGDRITPKTIEFKNGAIVSTYLDRKPDESMITKPSILTSRYFKVTDTTLMETTQ